MDLRFGLSLLGVAWLGLGCPRSGGGGDGGAPVEVGAASDAGAEDLSAVLEPVRVDGGIPALAAAAFDNSRMLALGAVGVRKQGDPAAVTRDDKWHLGSCTKAMTATLAALLAEEGTLTWSTTLEEAFGSDWVVEMDVAYRPVTLSQLLGHRGGTPERPSADLQDPLWMSGEVQAQRKTFVQGLLSRAPAQAPGSYVYSNAGYMVVGAYLEKLTGKSWEQLINERIFAPLGMASCGFGPQAAANTTDQPWGHELKSGSWVPHYGDNPPALGPAGTVHCSLEDWGKFLTEHLRAARGESTRLGLSKQSWAALHTPVGGGDYALGWIVASRSWSPGFVYTHAGSNTVNYAVVWLAPGINRVFVSATNAADDPSFVPADNTIGLLLQRYRK